MLATRLPYEVMPCFACLPPAIGQRVIRPLLYLGLYLAGEQSGKLSTTVLLFKHVLETLCVLWIHSEI